ncbi:MAG: NINE protein [Saprospiraceae bacterium]|nr:NINE protein [Saprospiraceae bacterium]
MKDKNVAGILALFFGWLGIHRFYLGQIGLGILYMFFFWVSWIIALIDAIAFFAMDKVEFDEKYNREMFHQRQNRYDKRTQDRRERWEQREQRRERPRQRPQAPPARQRQRPTPTPKRRHNPFKSSGLEKYREYDYEGAIEDFEKALEINPKDIAVHFNLACSFSLMENAERAFYHLDKAVSFGFNDVQKIKEHDALAFLRIQDQFEQFEQNNFQLTPQLEAPKENLLDAIPNNTSNDLLEQLQRLGELKEKGLLTEEEFTVQKKKLLG